MHPSSWFLSCEFSSDRLHRFIQLHDVFKNTDHHFLCTNVSKNIANAIILQITTKKEPLLLRTFSFSRLRTFRVRSKTKPCSQFSLPSFFLFMDMDLLRSGRRCGWILSRCQIKNSFCVDKADPFGRSGQKDRFLYIAISILFYVLLILYYSYYFSKFKKSKTQKLHGSVLVVISALLEAACGNL